MNTAELIRELENIKTKIFSSVKNQNDTAVKEIKADNLSNWLSELTKEEEGKTEDSVTWIEELLKEQEKENRKIYPKLKEEIYDLLQSSTYDFKRNIDELFKKIKPFGELFELIFYEYMEKAYPNCPVSQLWYNYCYLLKDYSYIKNRGSVVRIFLHSLKIFDIYADSNFYKTNSMRWGLYALIDEQFIEPMSDSDLIAISLLKKEVMYYEDAEDVGNCKLLLGKLYERIGNIEFALQAYIEACNDEYREILDEVEIERILKFISKNNLEKEWDKYVETPDLLKVFEKKPVVFNAQEFLERAEADVHKMLGDSKHKLDEHSLEHLVTARRLRLKREYKSSCLEFCHLFEYELRQKFFNPFRQSFCRDQHIFNRPNAKKFNNSLDPFLNFIEHKYREINLGQMHQVLKQVKNLKNIVKDSPVGCFLAFCARKNSFLIQDEFIEFLGFLYQTRNNKLAHGGSREMLMDDYRIIEKRIIVALKTFVANL